MAVCSQLKNHLVSIGICFLGLNGLITDKLGEAMSTTLVFTIHSHPYLFPSTWSCAEARVYADYDWPLTEQARHVGTAR
jgi:hypothetical protein